MYEFRTCLTAEKAVASHDTMQSCPSYSLRPYVQTGKHNRGKLALVLVLIRWVT